MKIIRIDTIPLQIPLKRHFTTAKARQTAARVVLIKLHTDEGTVGIGESDPRPHITGETVDSVLIAIRDYLAPALASFELSDSGDIEKLCNRMDEVLVSNPSAKAGIDIAAYDALGKANGVPVYSLLGPKERGAVTSCGFSDLGTLSDAQKDAQEYRELEGNAFKIKVSSNWDSDIERIEAVRSILGPSLELIVDPNQAWSVEQSIRILGKYGNRFAVCEQPIPWNDMEGLARISAAADVPVMADEAVWSPNDASILVQMKGADMVNIKHIKSGGLHRALDIAHIMDKENISCMIGSTTETGISSAASTHLSLVCPHMKYFDVAPPTHYITEDIVEGLNWTGCIVKPNEEPGLGIRLKEDIVRKYAV
jgi:L-alanine-DL-glutamate epimerase-like enolase superfamily enzyme